MLAREFGIVNGEFSNLRCLMNTLYDIQDILWMLMQSRGMMGTDWILVLWTAILPMALCKLKDKKITGFANFIDEWSQCDFCFTNFGVILEYLESSITMNKAIFRLSSTWSWHVYTIVRDTHDGSGSLFVTENFWSRHDSLCNLSGVIWTILV